MDKIAMVKQAEVSGVIAGLVDAEYIKLASAEDFDTVCQIVADNISEKDWTFDEVVEKTAEVMEEVYQIYEENGQLEKEAEVKAVEEVKEEEVVKEAELTDTEIFAAIGELTLAKEAGDVSEDEAESKMSKLKGMLKNNKGKIGAGVAGLGLAALAGKAGYDINKLKQVRGYDSIGKAAKAYKVNKTIDAAAAVNKARKFFKR